MKKLMIAAAVAAMIGGAFAAGYDFTASVKTTTGKQGKQTTTYKVNLGQNDQGVYWWAGEGYESADEGKADLKKWTNDEKEAFAAQIYFGDPQWDSNPLNVGKNEYGIPEYYKGKAVWCANFSYKVTDSDCYRTATSRKFKGVVKIDDCCDDAIWEFVTADTYAKDVNMVDFLGVKAEDILTTPVVCFTEKLFNRFGGVQLAKATKVEYAATILGEGASDFGDKFSWALAGQGAYDTKLDIVKNISGNIVGILENPDCENCCDDNQVATVFDCANGDTRVTPGDDATYDGTAAYGTWSIKYNKKY